MTPHQLLDRVLFPVLWNTNRRPRVFMFHSVGRSPVTLCTGDPGPQTDPDTFEEFLHWLRQHATLVTVSELSEIRARGGRYRDRIVALSLDDGYEDNYTIAYPLLRSIGAPATIYLTGDMVRHDPEVPGQGLTVDQIKEMAGAGFEFGAHSMTHPRLNHLDIKTAEEEIVRSKEAIEDLVSGPCYGFCYPYGSYSSEVRAVVERCGFRYAVTTQDRLTDRKDPFLMQRTVLPPDPTDADFAIRLAGAHAWRQSAFHLVRRGAGLLK